MGVFAGRAWQLGRVEAGGRQQALGQPDAFQMLSYSKHLAGSCVFAGTALVFACNLPPACITACIIACITALLHAQDCTCLQLLLYALVYTNFISSLLEDLDSLCCQ